MASTPSHCHVATSKSYQNQRGPTRSPHVHHHVAASKSPLQSPPLSSSSSALSPAFPLHSFSGRRSTRLVSKFHVACPKPSTSSSRHFPAARDTLLSLLNSDNVHVTLTAVASTLSSFEDHSFIIKELAAKKQFTKAVSCYRFFLSKQTNLTDRGKLATAVISALGRNGNHRLAREVFEEALLSGYGKTVFAFSALISAYGKCRDAEEAINVFNSMKSYSIKPNLVVYNALIDALGKSGVEFTRVAQMFDEMVANGIQPDRITFNSLLAVCSKGALWEAARELFREMEKRGIVQDIFSYNTLLDAICKGGRMDLAFDVMSEMPLRNIFPNVVTYSTVIDGYAKAGRLEEGLALFDEMKCLGIGLDRVSYNTLLSIYAKLGRFEEALEICKEMENSGIEKDVVTYNALLGGYGKQFKYHEVKRVFQDMKNRRVLPNLLTYSTLIDVYSKGGLYQEALQIFSEFKKVGLKPDVVLYSALIDALCKNGLVESAVSLLDEMTKEGIRPNVVTYNSIIDAFWRNVPRSQIVKMCEQLEKVKLGKNEGKQEIRCIIGVFHKMHELEIKPNVVTFSAILNACSRSNSFEEASMLLKELRMFDDKVYGVAHGLLTRGDDVWNQSLRLFDEVKLMDFSTASAFYNALTDMLWHFGQRKGAQLVVLEGKRRQLWENVWTESCLDLHLMSSGAACAMVHAWLLSIRSIVFDGRELPKLLSILTGWGKHSKIVGDSSLRRNVEALLNGMGAPFQSAKCNLGRFISNGTAVDAWLRDAETLRLLVLDNDRNGTMGAVAL